MTLSRCTAGLLGRSCFVVCHVWLKSINIVTQNDATEVGNNLPCCKNVLSLVSIWSSGSSRSSQPSQKMFRRSGRSYGNATQTIANDPDDWDNLDRLDRVEFYPDDRDDRKNFEAIIYGNALRRLRRSKAIPEVITFIPVIENRWSRKNNTQMFAERMGVIWN